MDTISILWVYTSVFPPGFRGTLGFRKQGPDKGGGGGNAGGGTFGEKRE